MPVRPVKLSSGSFRQELENIVLKDGDILLEVVLELLPSATTSVKELSVEKVTGFTFSLGIKAAPAFVILRARTGLTVADGVGAIKRAASTLRSSTDQNDDDQICLFK